jgi:hypothetical protein
MGLKGLLKAIIQMSVLLEENLRAFYNEMKERLGDLSPEQQQQYLEGVVYALTATVTFTDPRGISPFERENFVCSARSWAYNETQRRGLDPESKMMEMMDSNTVETAAGYVAAKAIQDAFGPQLTDKQELVLRQFLMLAQLED